MISRRDNLLIRPWLQRRYDNHRRKVQSALPAIDTNPPALRNHVVIKLKKQQQENERCRKIEQENDMLLQKIDYIMSNNRVDNRWTTPQRSFLNKVSLYHDNKSTKSSLLRKFSDESYDNNNIDDGKHLNGKFNQIENIHHRDDHNVNKNKHVLRTRSKSVPAARKPLENNIVSSPSSSVVKKQQSSSAMERGKSQNNHTRMYDQHTQSIIIKRGCLKLAVNFPSDTLVIYQEGHVEKILMDGANECNCIRNIV